jgi:hypothetical protein
MARHESFEILASAQAPEIHRSYFIEEDGSASSPAHLRPEELEQNRQRAYTMDPAAIHGVTYTTWHTPKIRHEAENKRRNY